MAQLIKEEMVETLWSTRNSWEEESIPGGNTHKHRRHV